MGDDRQPPKPPTWVHPGADEWGDATGPDPLDPIYTREQRAAGYTAEAEWHAGIDTPAEWEPEGGLGKCRWRGRDRWGLCILCDNLAEPGHPWTLCEEHNYDAGLCAHCYGAPAAYWGWYLSRAWRACPTCWRWLHRNRSKYSDTEAGDQALLDALAVVIDKRRARARAKPKPSRRRP